MTATIQVPLTDKHCPLGDAYAKKHLTTPPKAAILCCEGGACLRGEIARRAANLITRELAPDRTVRVCHGGLLETDSGMKDLVRHADEVLMLDGCAMACGSRLMEGAMPEVKPIVAATDGLYEFDRSKFSIDEMSDEDMDKHGRVVAEKLVAKHLA
jgi:uncharacterized metal-binding protein